MLNKCLDSAGLIARHLLKHMLNALTFKEVYAIIQASS